MADTYNPKPDGSEVPPPYAPQQHYGAAPPQQNYGAVPPNPPPVYPGPNSAYPPGTYQQYPPVGPGFQPTGTGYQPGYQPIPQAQPYGNNPVRVTQNVVVVGGCPACRVGALEEDFTVLGILLAIIFFPLGIICCLAMTQRRCRNCGAVFG